MDPVAVFDQEKGAALEDSGAVFPESETVPERPSWLPVNFRTPADLAKSYAAAEKKIHTQAAELKSLRAQLAEQPADPDSLRAVLAEHRAEFFAQQRAESEHLLAFDARLGIAEDVARKVGGAA